MKNYKNLVLSVLTVLIVSYLLALSFLAVFGHRLVFYPHRTGYKFSPHLTMLTLSPREKVAVYYLPPHGQEPVIMFNHDNQSDISDWMPKAHQAHERGYGVLLYDYLGYGLSYGRVSQRNCYRSARRAFDHLTQTLSIPPERIIVYGHGVGATVALDLAVSRPAHRLVLDSPVTNLFRSFFHGRRVVPWDYFDGYTKLEELTPTCHLEVRYPDMGYPDLDWHVRQFRRILKQRPLPLGFITLARPGRYSDFMLP